MNKNKFNEFLDALALCIDKILSSLSNYGEMPRWGIDPDYPKYSIWNDGYYLTFQGFTGFALNSPQQVAVMDRSKMLKGSPNAGMILANLPTPPDQLGGKNSLKSAPKTLDCDASALPPFGTPEYLVYFENKTTGGLLNILQDDINQLEQFLSQGPNEIIQLIVNIIVMGLISFFYETDVCFNLGKNQTFFKNR